MSRSTTAIPTLPKAKETFYFTSRLNLTVLTGRQARDLAEFLENIKTAPGSVIYHHTHHFLEQHQSISPEPPNDFAYWVTNVLQENILGEKLAAIDVIQFPTITSLQEKIISTIEEYMDRHPGLRSAPPGEEFNFMRAITFVIPTPYKADNLLEFYNALQRISVHALYFHIFEARLRLGKTTNDFTAWLSESLNDPGLGQAVANLDPYTHTLEGLRRNISRLIHRRLEEQGHA